LRLRRGVILNWERKVWEKICTRRGSQPQRRGGSGLVSGRGGNQRAVRRLKPVAGRRKRWEEWKKWCGGH